MGGLFGYDSSNVSISLKVPSSNGVSPVVGGWGKLDRTEVGVWRSGTGEGEMKMESTWPKDDGVP